MITITHIEFAVVWSPPGIVWGKCQNEGISSTDRRNTAPLLTLVINFIGNIVQKAKNLNLESLFVCISLPLTHTQNGSCMELNTNIK